MTGGVESGTEADCPCCDGDGCHLDPDMPDCSECENTGRVTAEQKAAWDAMVGARIR